MDQGFLRDEAESWLKWDPNPNTRGAVDAALSKEDWTTLQEYFGHGRLDFGTAGLRGRMGAGTCAMNDLTVIQTTQGLATVLEEEFGERGKAKGVVIGYDHRADAGVSSHGLALATAAVLLHRGFRVLLYRGLVPTPLVPFGVRLHGACAGVMITASHNPKQDNGYKLYWANAVQIIPPIDQRVAAATTSCLSPWLSPYPSSDDTVRSHPRCLDPTTATVDAYLSQLSAKLCRFPQDNAKRQGGSVVYTPMHGVGEPFASAAFRAFHLPPFTPVPEQARADPAFPTVRFPNPEEKGALSLACALAEKQGAWLVLANDPDADRLAVAERGEDGGGWHVFSGNDIGTMLGCWQWEQWRAAHPDAPASDAAVVVSTVSSKMLRAVAKAEGFEFHETLTGFKWIGNKALELQSGGKSVLLGYEEAIGFCVAPQVVPDKDGVSASAMVAEMAMHLRDQRGGLSLHRYLRSLHAKYGEFASANGYFFLPPSQPSVVPDIFARLRNGGKYWEAVGPHRIKSIRDLTSPGYDSSTADKRPSLPVSSGTQMLTYEMEEGVVLTLRTSGTEPKLKYYSEMQGQPGVPLEQVERRLKELLALLLEELLQPDQNGLRRP